MLDEAIEFWSRAGAGTYEAIGRLDRLPILSALDEREAVRQDLAWIEAQGTHNLGWRALFTCALSHHFLHALEMAVSRYEEALASSPPVQDDCRGALLSMLAAAEAEVGQIDAAAEHLAQAREQILPKDQSSQAFLTISQTLCSNHGLQLENARTDVEEWARGLLEELPWTNEVSVHLRMATKLLV